MKPKKESKYSKKESNLLTTADVMVLFDITRSTLDNWMTTGELRPIAKIGGTLYFSKKALNEKCNNQLFVEA